MLYGRGYLHGRRRAQGVKMALLAPWLIRGTPSTLVPPRELRAGRAQKVGFWGPQGRPEGPKWPLLGSKMGPFFDPLRASGPPGSTLFGPYGLKRGSQNRPRFLHKVYILGQNGPFWTPFGPLTCLLYTSPSPRDRQKSRMPSSA